MMRFQRKQFIGLNQSDGLTQYPQMALTGSPSRLHYDCKYLAAAGGISILFLLASGFFVWGCKTSSDSSRIREAAKRERVMWSGLYRGATKSVANRQQLIEDMSGRDPRE